MIRLSELPYGQSGVVVRIGGAGALRRLGLQVTEGEGELDVTPPSYRFDLQIEADLIEEVTQLRRRLQNS